MQPKQSIRLNEKQLSVREKHETKCEIAEHSERENIKQWLNMESEKHNTMSVVAKQEIGSEPNTKGQVYPRLSLP